MNCRGKFLDRRGLKYAGQHANWGIHWFTWVFIIVRAVERRRILVFDQQARRFCRVLVDKTLKEVWGGRMRKILKYMLRKWIVQDIWLRIVSKCASWYFFHDAIFPSEPGPPHYRGFRITLRHTTLGRTPLDEWSARRKDTCMPRRDSNPQSQQANGRRPHALDRTTTGIGKLTLLVW